MRGGHRLEVSATRRFLRLMIRGVRTPRLPAAGGASSTPALGTNFRILVQDPRTAVSRQTLGSFETRIRAGYFRLAATKCQEGASFFRCKGSDVGPATPRNGPRRSATRGMSHRDTGRVTLRHGLVALRHGVRHAATRPCRTATRGVSRCDTALSHCDTGCVMLRHGLVALRRGVYHAATRACRTATRGVSRCDTASSHCDTGAPSAFYLRKSADQPAGQAIASANPGSATDSSSMCALAMPSSSRSSTPLTVVSCWSARYSSMSM